MEFVKSSYSMSNGTCVEAAFVRSTFCADRQCVEAAFVKSTFSTSGACVEAAPSDGTVLVRDSKDRNGGTLEFSRAEWYDFLEAIRGGELDDL